jgi:quercetin dioxygenase-like cupin family protein
MATIDAQAQAVRKITAGTWLQNKATGERSLLVKLPAETGGRYFEIEYICRPFRGKNSIPAHYHSTCSERFEILAGRARYLLGKEERTAETGETVVLPPRISHIHPWSDSNEELHVRMFSEADPPDVRGLNANINAAITQYGLASDGKVDKDGHATFLQLAVSANSVLPGACPAGMSIGMARAVLGTFAIIGRIAGYRVSYPQYGEV